MLVAASGASSSQDDQGDGRASALLYDLDSGSPRPAKNNKYGPWTESPDKQPLQKLQEGVLLLLEGQQRLERLLLASGATTGSPGKGYAVDESPRQRSSGGSVAPRFGDVPETSEWIKDDPGATQQKSMVVETPGDAPDACHSPPRMKKIFSRSATVRVCKELEGSYELFEQACTAALADFADLDDSDADREDRVQTAMTPKWSAPAFAATKRRAGKLRRTFENGLIWGPASGMRTTVDLLSIPFLMYDAFALPFLFAFDVPMEGTIFYNSLIVALFWTCDMLFRFRCSYFRQDTGTLETRPSMIAMNYLKGTFLLDISIITIDVVCLTLAVWSQNAKTTESDALKFRQMGQMSRLVRVTSLLRLRTMPKLFDNRILQNRTVNMMHNILKLTLVILWLNHMMACVWMPIGKMEGDTGMTWLDTDIGGGATSYRDSPTLYQYSTSLHWALTQMTPGSMQVFPVNSSERVFNCWCLLFGLLVFSTLISSISATVTQFKMAMQKQGDMLDKMNNFLRTAEVSSQLAMQVRQLVKEKLKHRNPLTIKDVEVLELLPLSLKKTLQVQVNLPLVVKHGYFMFLAELDSVIAEKICFSCCEAHGMGKQDTLFLQSTAARAMYFVKRGELKYTTSKGAPWVMAQVSRDTAIHETRGETVIAGDWLSEAALWCDWLHVGSAECFTTAPCEVMKLWTAKMLSVLTENQTDLVPQVTCAYAHSFASCLASHQDSDVGEGATDLNLPFSVDEVMGAMPRKARLLMGHVAFRVIRNRKSGYLDFTGQISSRKLDLLRAEVKAGKCMVMLNSCSKLGVNRVVALVVLKLRRDDGRVLVELKNTNDPARVATKLPGAKMQEGELPEQCLQRVLNETLGPEFAGKVARSGKESEIEMDSSNRYAIPTRYQKSIFLAGLDAGEECEDHPALTLTTSDPSSPFDPLHKDNLTTLASGDYGTWLTDDEIDIFATTAGKAELSRRLAVGGLGPEPPKR